MGPHGGLSRAIVIVPKQQFQLKLEREREGIKVIILLSLPYFPTTHCPPSREALKSGLVVPGIKLLKFGAEGMRSFSRRYVGACVADVRSFVYVLVDDHTDSVGIPSVLFHYKGTLLGPQIGNPKNIVGIYSYYILGVPYLGFPVESLYIKGSMGELLQMCFVEGRGFPLAWSQGPIQVLGYLPHLLHISSQAFYSTR